MNNYPLQIFVDNDTALMIQAFIDEGVGIDFDKLLALMADNAESISGFIQYFPRAISERCCSNSVL